MHSTVYLHPQQTIVATWRTDGAVPTLIDYAERSPREPLTAMLENIASVDVCVHGDLCIAHAYPVRSGEDHAARRTFELLTCLPTVDREHDLLQYLEYGGTLHGTTWNTILVIPEAVIASVHRLTRPSVQIHTDIEMDVVAASRAMANDADTYMVIGRRGNQWFRSIHGASGSPLDLRSINVSSEMSAGAIVTEALLAARSATGTMIDRVVLFGDFLTKATYNAITISLQDVGAHTSRLQPFRIVRSGVLPDVARTLMTRAHLYGPLVGPIVQQAATMA